MFDLPLHHVAIAVPSIEDARGAYELVSGATCTAPEEVLAQGVRVAFVGLIELLEPLGSDGPVARFLQRRGAGLHHLAYSTPNLENELARLSEAGVRLIDSTPRVGAGGHLIAFIHPSSTGGTLIELVQEG